MAKGSEGWRAVVRELGLALVTLGAVVLLFVAYELVGTNITEQHSQARLAREFTRSLKVAGPAGTVTAPPRSTGARAVARTSTTGASRPVITTTTNSPAAKPVKPAPAHKPKAPAHKKRGSAHVGSLTALPSVPPGGALDHMQVPAIGVDRYVVQGVAEADLQMGPGHYPGTPLPGQPGNVAIAGHRTTFGAPFFELNQLVKGDLIYLTDTDGNTWVYRVQRQWVVPPTDMGVLAPTAGAELTLTTCNPRFEATSRLVVRASLFERFRPGTRLPLPLPARLGHTSSARARVRLVGGDGRSTAAAKADRTAPARTAPARTVPTPTTRAGATVTSTVPVSTVPVSTVPVSTLPASAPTSVATTPAAAASGQDDPTVGPAAARAPDNVLGTGGSTAWAGASLWGALALACWVATRSLAARQRRWSKVLVLTAGAVVCLLPLWFSFGNVVNLLPANI